MKAYLIQIDGWDGATATPVRLASHDDDRLCHLNGQTWWPAIATLPTLRYDFFDGAFDAGSITSPTGSFTAAIGAIPNLPALALHDARIRIWRGELGDAWGAFTLLFDGRVKEQPAISDGIASFGIGTDDSWLDQPLLSTYAGTGSAEGSTDLQGQVKPLALGAPRFAPAVLVDAVDNIYQLSAYGAINSVTNAFDQLVRFGPVDGSASDFDSLKDADLSPGDWGVNLSGGYVRFGAPPAGMVSFHVLGDEVGAWSRLPGDIIARIASIAGGAAKVASADITALNAARTWNLSLMVTAQTTARDLIQRIAASVNAVAYVDWLGMLRVAAVGIGAPTLTIAADGSTLPPVAAVEQVAIAAPYWRLAQGAVPTWQVHSLTDIAFSAALNPRGPYDHAETYREGDMVTLANGSQWLFVGASPATASSPADDNPNWFRLSDNITADNITYVDGTPMEELKPAEPGATDGAPAGSPVGDEEAQAVVDGMRTNALNIAEEALRNGTYREQTDDIIKLPDGRTVRTLIDQLGTIVDGIQTYVNFLREVDTAGNGKWALTVENSIGAITGMMNLLTGEGLGTLRFVGDILEAVDPDSGDAKFIFRYGLDNRLILNDVYIEKLEVGAVKTTSIDFNQVTGKTYWQASYTSGEGASALGAASGGAWYNFGLTGAKASVAPQGGTIPAGSEVTIRMYVNMKRTGTDDDRVWFRLRRDGPSGSTYIGDIVRSGMSNYPSVTTYEWQDEITTSGSYTYHLEFYLDEGGGTYYGAKLICDVGKR